MGLTLKGGNGTSPQVQLRASLPEGKLSFKDKALELGNIPVGVPQATVAVLRNTGSHDGIFLVRPGGRLRGASSLWCKHPGSRSWAEGHVNCVRNAVPNLWQRQQPSGQRP